MDDLLQRARQGDGEAFAKLFDQCAPALWKTAVSVMDDEDAAADALQETAIKAWRSIPSFNRACTLATWLTRILLNTCFDELRAKKRLVPFGDIADATDAAEGALLSHGSGSALCTEVCDRVDIERVLQRLSPDDRLILTLFYVNDFPIAQIAEVLDLSESATRTRLSRARTRFKKIYEKPAGTAALNPATGLAGMAI